MGGKRVKQRGNSGEICREASHKGRLVASQMETVAVRGPQRARTKTVDACKPFSEVPTKLPHFSEKYKTTWSLDLTRQ